MSIHWDPREQLRIGRYLVKWTVLASAVGVCGGTASAVFLLSLEAATNTREAKPWLVYLLPVAGLVIGLIYHLWGKDVERGNNLILDEIHKPQAGVSGGMAPLILFATVGTHLFGGSAGREGTAVQMGGSLAAWIARRLGLDRSHTRILLMTGISAGFGSVFGTPIAGLVFGLEVLAVGRMRYDALIPCMIGSQVGDWSCTAWGVRHTQYHVEAVPAVSSWLVISVLLSALVFAIVSIVFAELTHGLQRLFARAIPWAPGRPVLGGMIVIALMWGVGTRDYLGLGVPQILASFTPEGVPTWAFFWKLVFTAVTLGSGFKGGEVTPIFFMGAAMGCTLGTLLGMPHDFMAALGFVAVFAGAANTPLACTIMGIELFGAPLAPYLAIACCGAYVWSGHRGIYLSQIVDTPKTDDPYVDADGSLRDVRGRQKSIFESFGFLARLRRRVRPTRPDGGDNGPTA